MNFAYSWVPFGKSLSTYSAPTMARSDQKDPLYFHPNEVARFAKDVLRIKEVTVEVLNSPSTATQQMLGAILEELRGIRAQLEGSGDEAPSDLAARRDRQDRPAA